MNQKLPPTKRGIETKTPICLADENKKEIRWNINFEFWEMLFSWPLLLHS